MLQKEKNLLFSGMTDQASAHYPMRQASFLKLGGHLVFLKHLSKVTV